MWISRLLKAFASIALVISTACTTSGMAATSLVKSDIHASVVLRKATVHDATQARFVHAKVKVFSSGRKLRSMNLNCLTLTIDGVVSDQIDVDSHASILNDPYPADENGLVEVAVYWVFLSSGDLSSQSLRSAQIGIVSNKGTCFSY